MGVHPPLRHAWRRASSRVSLMLLPVALGTFAVVAPSGAASLRTGPVAAAAKTTGPIAVATRTVEVNLYANYHLVGRPGHTITEEGTFHGSASGTATSHSVAFSTALVQAQYSGRSKGGTFSGTAYSHNRTVGAIVYCSGTANITAGTGEWAHASNVKISFTGTFNRQNYSFSEHITGSFQN